MESGVALSAGIGLKAGIVFMLASFFCEHKGLSNTCSRKTELEFMTVVLKETVSLLY